LFKSRDLFSVRLEGPGNLLLAHFSDLTRVRNAHQSGRPPTTLNLQFSRPGIVRNFGSFPTLGADHPARIRSHRIDQRPIFPTRANQFDFPDVASLTRAFRRANRVRQNRDFVRRFKLIWVVQSQREKYFACTVGQINATDSRVLLPHEGRFAIVTNVGCGMRWTCRRVRRTLLVRTAKSCGPDAPTLASSFAGSFPQSDGGKRARSPGRARSNR
jgi:hypothetical protein